MGLHTALYEAHRSHGAKIVDFGGWDMPVMYSSIVEEHEATRNAAGLFDVSHMGRIWFTGNHAADALDSILTNSVASLEVGQVRYSLILNDEGGIRDDVLVYRLEEAYLLVVNASNRLKLLPILSDIASSHQTVLDDRTETTSMLAIQGPQALSLAQQVLHAPLEGIPYYHVTPSTTELGPETLLVSRTGYTGEDGIEVLGPHAILLTLWNRLLDAGRDAGVRPAGLGARDALRLEAGMPLYGHELSEEIDPLQAGLGWAVAKGKTFIGQKGLEDRPSDQKTRVGLALEGRRIAREGFSILVGDDVIGWVTSGTFSPTLNRSIAMGYVDPGARSVGTQLTVDVRGTRVAATVVKLPFYKRKRSGGIA